MIMVKLNMSRPMSILFRPVLGMEIYKFRPTVMLLESKIFVTKFNTTTYHRQDFLTSE